MRSFLTILACTLLLASCRNERRILILYYSQNGTTKAVAEEFQRQTGAHIEAITVKEPYDGNFDQTISRCLDEKQKGILPTLVRLKHNPSRYDVIFIGYPVWFGTYAPPIESFVRKYSLEEKTVIPFCTFGSGGLNTSSSDLEKALPNARIGAGYGVRAARIDEIAEEIERFLILGGFREGEVAQYEEYSQQAPVTDEEASIFSAACSSYQFDLGKPLTVGCRHTDKGIDYRFVARVNDRNGEPTTTTVYVTCREGKAPVFTEVVR